MKTPEPLWVTENFKESIMESSMEVLLAAEEKMDKCVEFLHHELSGLRTGKASPGLVENITEIGRAHV